MRHKEQRKRAAAAREHPGYIYIPEHGPRMSKTIRPCLAADAAHMKLSGDTATVFGIWGQDGNKGLINLALMVVYDTESKRTWSLILKAFLDLYPHLDTNDLYIIADGDKGFRAAFDDVVQHGHKFLCAHHKDGNMKTQPGCTKTAGSCTGRQSRPLLWLG